MLALHNSHDIRTLLIHTTSFLKVMPQSLYIPDTRAYHSSINVHAFACNNTNAILSTAVKCYIHYRVKCRTSTIHQSLMYLSLQYHRFASNHQHTCAFELYQIPKMPSFVINACPEMFVSLTIASLMTPCPKPRQTFVRRCFSSLTS